MRVLIGKALVPSFAFFSRQAPQGVRHIRRFAPSQDIEDPPNLTTKTCRRRDCVKLAFSLLAFPIITSANTYTIPHSPTDLSRYIQSDDAKSLDGYLTHGGNPNGSGSFGWPLLFEAAYFSADKCAADLLRKGANPSARYAPEGSALDISLSNGDANLAQLLLAYGATLPAKAKKRDALLALAVRTQSVPLVRKLTELGARVENSDQYSVPLIAETASTAMADALIIAGADVTADGNLALEQASAAGNLPLVDLLLSHGANPNDHSGLTFPLIDAARWGHLKVVKALLDAHANPNVSDPSGNNLYKSYGKLATELWKLHPQPPNGRDLQGTTALLEASAAGWPDIVSLLLGAHADVNESNSDGDTPLLYAARYGHVSVLKTLIAHGANVNCKTRMGLTPLMAAAFEGSAESVRALLAAGATRTDRLHGKTAEDIAHIDGNADALAVLQGRQVASHWDRDFSIAELGVPSNEIRRQLLDSLLFQSLKLLSLTNTDGRQLGVDPATQTALQAEISGLGEALTALISRRKALIQNEMHAAISVPRKIKFLAVDAPNASAWTELDGNTIQIVVTDKLIRADLESSTNVAFPGKSIAYKVAALRELRRQIENSMDMNGIAVKSPALGTATFATTDLKAVDDYMALVNMAQKFEPVVARYFGSMMFVLGHELGHAALGHLYKRVECPGRELDADRFAAYLLGDSFLALSETPIPVTVENSSQSTIEFTFDDDAYALYTGSAQFFLGSYEVAHFPTVAGGCRYPSAARRLAVTAAVLRKVEHDRSGIVLRELERERNIYSLLGFDFVSRLRSMGAQ